MASFDSYPLLTGLAQTGWCSHMSDSLHVLKQNMTALQAMQMSCARCWSPQLWLVLLDR